MRAYPFRVNNAALRAFISGADIQCSAEGAGKPQIINLTEDDKMKARLPKGFNNGGGQQNIQQLARQAQKMQEEMDEASKELEQKEYTATAGGGQVAAVVTGALEIKSLEISKDVVDPEDIEMLSDLVIAAVNEAIREARDEKASTMDKISGGLNVPGLF